MKPKHEVGCLIRKGLTSEEIQSRIADFPTNPSLDYFIGLGYSKNTAAHYKYLLNKNNSADNHSEKNSSSNLIFSKNANANNIILDTCALQHKETRKILSDSDSVTVLYATIKEFDRGCKKDNMSQYLKFNIREETKKMLFSDSRYHLSPFDWKNNNYTDEIILDYMSMLSLQDRPTLLTADQNFALRAKCLGFEYILYSERQSQPIEKTIKTNKNKSVITQATTANHHKSFL